MFVPTFICLLLLLLLYFFPSVYNTTTLGLSVVVAIGATHGGVRLYLG
jgi:hypothetical protein